MFTLAFALVASIGSSVPSQGLPTVEFQVATQQGVESDGSLTATLELSAAHTDDVTVPFTLSGTAETPDDYTITPSPIVIPMGATTADIVMTLDDDALYEIEETVIITLGTPTNATLGTIVEHTAGIDDNDLAPSMSFSTGGLVFEENQAVVQAEIALNAVAGVDIHVPFTVQGTAKMPEDYSIQASPLLIRKGKLNASIQSNVVNDLLAEGAEYVFITLGQPDHGTLGQIQRFTMLFKPSDLGFGGFKGPTAMGLPVTATPLNLNFGANRMGDAVPSQTIQLQNDTGVPVVITDLNVLGTAASDFTHDASLPIGLPAGAGTSFDVTFSPTAKGQRNAVLFLRQSPYTPVRQIIPVSGIAYGPTTEEVLVNAAGKKYTSQAGDEWVPDYGTIGSSSGLIISRGAIANTTDDGLYRSGRQGADFGYRLTLPDGPYDVTLHYAETEHTAAGSRVFDVSIEGQLVQDDFDIVAAAGADRTAHAETFRVTVAGGELDIDFLASVDEALISALEVRSFAEFGADPAALDFGNLDPGQVGDIDLTIENLGLHPLHVDTFEILVDDGDGTDFRITLDGQLYQGAGVNQTFPVDITFDGLESMVAACEYIPAEHSFNELRFRFSGDFGTPMEVDVLGSAGVGGDPFMHPIADVQPVVVDYDSNATEDVLLDGSESHTHEPGHILTTWEWREGGNLVSTQEVDTLPFSLGNHQVELTILDDNNPPRELAVTADFRVVPVDNVPGVLSLYYRADPPTTTAMDLLDAVPAVPDFAEVLENYSVVEVDGNVGNSGIISDVMVRLIAKFTASGAESYEFFVTGGVDTRIELDGSPVAGVVVPSAGEHVLEVRYAVDVIDDVPLDLMVSLGGNGAQAFDPTALTHDSGATTPVINSMPQEGISLGGNQIVIDGFGFYPENQVVLHWGNTDYTSVDFDSWSGTQIVFTTPPRTPGFITVTVESPLGVSNPWEFEYKDNGPVPITFVNGPNPGVTQPTCAAWGPDGRLYVGSRNGTITAIVFNDDYTVDTKTTYNGISALQNKEIMGIAFNPYDPPSPIKVYVAHTEMFAQGGGAFPGTSPYPGGVSVLSGPNFEHSGPGDDLITQLPTSNHDHGVNGMVFDNNGDLLVTVGGNTNAGVKYWKIGDLPESPLSGAIILARTSLGGSFNGDLQYEVRATGTPSTDQVEGEEVDLVQGDVIIWATGFRNTFDLELTVSGRVYATDNGPNTGYGFASTGPNSQTGFHPWDDDEVMLARYGHYYGHPNRARGREIAIENIYYNTSAPEVPGFTQALAVIPSSINGIAEYRARTFGDAMRGDLLAQKWNSNARRLELSTDGTSVTTVSNILPNIRSLGIVVGPGGALLGSDYSNNKIRTLLPDDVTATDMTPFDITPWRATSDGGAEFVIGGKNFGSIGNTTVEIDGIPATLTSVSSERIRGIVPAHPNPTQDPVDVAITVGAETRYLPDSFLYLPFAPALWQGDWTSASQMPVALGEVTSAAIDGVLYVVGESSNKTLAYDIASDTWVDNLAVRPFTGHHHSGEVYDGKWYVVGGLGSGQGRVQIYDPATNNWSLGVDMQYNGAPWLGGSVCTALIGDKIYVSGGIVGSTTVDNAAVYDISDNAWTDFAPMPNQKGRNHAATATDGKKVYVFGGRGIGSGACNCVANGFDDVQIYDPATDTWEASFDPGSSIAPMPLGRGGMGKAIYFQGRFMVFGGETLTGPGAKPGNVYDRVDIYDPVANTWTVDSEMPTPRHGIFPTVYQHKVYVAGGGLQAGFSKSKVMEIYGR